MPLLKTFFCWRRLGPIAARLAISGLLLPGGCATGRSAEQLAPTLAASNRDPPATAQIPVGVRDEGWHTGLVLSAANLAPPLAVLRRRFPDARYLEFGWGNRGFYLAPQPGIGTALSSLFPSPSVLFVQGLQQDPDAGLSSASVLRWLCVSAAGYRRLEAYVEGYFLKGQHGELVSLESRPSRHGEFFASAQSYDAFHTCNTWTATALRSAGLPVGDRGVIFARQVMSEIRGLHACPQSTSRAAY